MYHWEKYYFPVEAFTFIFPRNRCKYLLELLYTDFSVKSKLILSLFQIVREKKKKKNKKKNKQKKPKKQQQQQNNPTIFDFSMFDYFFF